MWKLLLVLFMQSPDGAVTQTEIMIHGEEFASAQACYEEAGDVIAVLPDEAVGVQFACVRDLRGEEA